MERADVREFSLLLPNMKAPLHHYKFRAEMLSDISLLAVLLPMAEVDPKDLGELGDVEVILRTMVSLAEVSDILAHVPDGHVMVETLAPVAAYTGNRTV